MGMPDDEHGRKPSGADDSSHWLAPWFDKVSRLWDWHNIHQTQSTEWWEGQRRWNTRYDERTDASEKRLDIMPSCDELEALEDMVKDLAQKVTEHDQIFMKVVAAAVMGGAIAGILTALGLKLF